ncbi:MAG: pyrimidine 5'-nucleotidase [Alphaproteobacteria bacterium]|nr:pyrimidine 5'-nucleotidase [Alphaproteobacteria bacterium]
MTTFLPVTGNFGLSGVYPHLRDMVEKALRLAFDTGGPHGPAVPREIANSAESTPSAPDFRCVDTWVFDLDHTLYTTTAEQDRDMEERICRFVQDHFGIAREPAFQIQKNYLREHGTTLAGLLKNHAIDPDAYHDAVNDIEALELQPDPELRKGLARLPGRRFVFTNNCGRYARAVLAKLAVEDLFHGIIDAHAMNFVPKPQQEAYAALLAQGQFDPGRAALFDDSMRNLAPARAMGMKTVWFNHGLGLSSHFRLDAPEKHIDYETDDLAAFLNSIRI